jgi:prepilin-type N-terminal cleavage/methylation domain-containing protein
MFDRAPNQRRRPAFTLIEILCVVVILAIAAAIVVAGVSGDNDLNAKSAARVVMTDLLYAQNRAIATQSPVYVKFSTSTNSYGLYSALNPAAVYITDPATQANYNTTLGSSAIPNSTLSSVSLGGQTVLYFDELGTPYSCATDGTSATALTTAGAVNVSSGKATVTISVQPNTGDITVSD